MLCILPWEPDFYKKYNYQAFYVGNPLVNDLASYKHKAVQSSSPVVALLPGSRLGELKYILPVYANLCRQRPQLRFRLSVMSHLPKDMYHSILLLPNVEQVVDDNYALLEDVDAAVVASGTATLEAALIGTPQVVCYKLDNLTRLLLPCLKLFLLKYRLGVVSLVNIILNRVLVPELLNRDFSADRTARLVDQLLYDQELRARIQAGYLELRAKLGDQDAASEAAQKLLAVYQRDQKAYEGDSSSTNNK